MYIHTTGQTVNSAGWKFYV